MAGSHLFNRLRSPNTPGAATAGSLNYLINRMQQRGVGGAGQQHPAASPPTTTPGQMSQYQNAPPNRATMMAVQPRIETANATQSLREQIQSINNQPYSAVAPVSEWTGSSHNAPYIENALRSPMSQGRNSGNIAANQFLQQRQYGNFAVPEVSQTTPDQYIQQGAANNATTAAFQMGGHPMSRLQALVQQQGLQAPSSNMASLNQMAGQAPPINVRERTGEGFQITPETADQGTYQVDSSNAQTNANRGFGSGSQDGLQVSVDESGRAQLLPRMGWQRPSDQDERGLVARERLQARNDNMKLNRAARYNTPAGRQARAEIARREEDSEAQAQGYGSLAERLSSERQMQQDQRLQNQQQERLPLLAAILQADPNNQSAQQAIAEITGGEYNPQAQVDRDRQAAAINMFLGANDELQNQMAQNPSEQLSPFLGGLDMSPVNDVSPQDIPLSERGSDSGQQVLRDRASALIDQLPENATQQDRIDHLVKNGFAIREAKRFAGRSWREYFGGGQGEPPQAPLPAATGFGGRASSTSYPPMASTFGGRRVGSGR